MSSSLVLSPDPHTISVPEPPHSHTRPQRSTRTAVNYSERAPDRSSISPTSTTPTRSAAMSTRSRRSISSSLSAADRSPDKRSLFIGRRTLSPLFNSEGKDAALGLILGDEASTEEEASEESKAALEEEGEEEVDEDMEEEDPDVDIGSNGEEELEEEVEEEDQDSKESVDETENLEDVEDTQTPVKAAQSALAVSTTDITIPTSTRVTRQRTRSPEKKPMDEPTKKSVLRLVFGKKRKAEAEAEPTEREETPAGVTIATEEPVISQDANHDAVFEELRDDARKRMPRKKRKWLKKGEVDPDDPVAVARQRERHKLIDEAIEDLNKQEEMLLKDAHPQLLWLWEELERRRELQFNWLEARHEATIGDLERLRDHEAKVAKSDFKIKREELANTMIKENRQKMARTAAERTALKRLPGSTPGLRGGRGGGGWPVATDTLLSNGEQPVVPLTSGDDPSMRRDISRTLQSLAFADAKADLDKVESLKIKRQHRSSTPPNVPARSSASHRSLRPHPVEPQRDVKPARVVQQQPFHAGPRTYQPSPSTSTYRPSSIWDPPKSSIIPQVTKNGAPRPPSPVRLNPPIVGHNLNHRVDRMPTTSLGYDSHTSHLASVQKPQTTRLPPPHPRPIPGLPFARSPPQYHPNPKIQDQPRRIWGPPSTSWNPLGFPRRA
ncbi:hypothetical protein I302_100156 [Kwoniella bestiolae CBS 10118]|uniref:Uncharacterized protein n=1 Tax=Kwoniella bestiolae CBS 10118 TaxID=1296100 RepID=A0A1B9G479_9TREE|nr:hypothetical protein I302_03531 [Kwoniella bestiolae CBS 10118]OCF25857.1 hypothetical protein I302_03531 [Kwoniella bestiolae CBS 10118]